MRRGLTSSFQYQRPTVDQLYTLRVLFGRITGPTNIVGLGSNSGGWITNLTTPYGSTSFSFYQVSPTPR